MTRAFLSAALLLPLLAVAGCATAEPAPEPETEDVVEQPADEEVIAYEYQPIATGVQSVGWPSDAMTAPYLVSLPVAEACHHDESTLVMGTAIGEAIPVAALAEAEGFACGMTPSAMGGDAVDEVAWRVAPGAAGLLSAYAETVFADEATDCTAEVPIEAPGISIEYRGTWYLLRSAGVACAETVQQIIDGMAAVQLTEELRHTTTYNDYVARGY